MDTASDDKPGTDQTTGADQAIGTDQATGATETLGADQATGAGEVIGAGLVGAAPAILSVRSAGQAARRRAGITFGPVPIDVEVAALEPEQIAAILSDPLLAVRAN